MNIKEDNKNKVINNENLTKEIDKNLAKELRKRIEELRENKEEIKFENYGKFLFERVKEYKEDKTIDLPPMIKAQKDFAFYYANGLLDELNNIKE